MLGICLRVLSILGIVLLILLVLLAAGFLLVLFFPFSYRVCGRKDGEGLRLTVKGRWLFGLLRAACRYPEPGRITVKILCFTLYNQTIFSEDKGDGKASEKKKRKKAAIGRKEKSAVRPDNKGIDGPEKRSNDKTAANPDCQPERTIKKETLPSVERASDPGQDDGKSRENSNQENKESFLGKLSSKKEKIKYTFCNIYDKIKKIRQNISYYTGLLQKEETKQLLSDSILSFRKIWRIIRPKHIKADIRFGTGSPDTTGYLYGVYCVLSSGLGPGLLVVPDFEEAVFEGEFDLSGRITVWVLLVNGLKMYQLIRKLRTEKK